MCTEHGAFPGLDSSGAGTSLNDGRVTLCWFVDIKRWIRSSVPLLLKSWLVIGRELRSLPLGFNQHLSRGKKGPFSIAIFLYQDAKIHTNVAGAFCSLFLRPILRTSKTYNDGMEYEENEGMDPKRRGWGIRSISL